MKPQYATPICILLIIAILAIGYFKLGWFGGTVASNNSSHDKFISDCVKKREPQGGLSPNIVVDDTKACEEEWKIKQQNLPV